MGWKVIIGDTPTSTTFDANIRFDLQTRVQDDENGVVNYIETFIEVEGDVVKGTAASVSSALVAIEALARVATTTRVRLQLDSVDKFDYKTTECLASPRITFFKTIQEDGGGDSHWRYAFTIYIKKAGGSGSGNSNTVTELNTSLQVVTEGTRVVRKIWKISCKAATAAAAYTFAQSFKPAGNNIHGELERFWQEARCAGGWIWDARRTDDIIDIVEEPITYTRWGNDYLVSQQVGKPGKPAPNPIVHQLASDATLATVRGYVLGYKNTISIPAAHWSESKDIIRWSAAEQTFNVQIEDLAKGTWRLPYMEVWIFLGEVPNPNHSNHKAPDIMTPPGDGKMST